MTLPSIPALIAFLGYPGFALVVFGESALLIGIFLPGDSLLITAGLLASRGLLDIITLVPLAVVAAIAGDSFGYWTGKRFGRKLFSREESIFFKKEYVTRTEEFYKKHGKKAIVLARFVPIVRSFAPIFAGIGEMEYRVFGFYNALGGIIWGAGLVLAGYFLGSAFPDLDNYLLLIILGIILISIIPIGLEFLRRNKNSETALD